MSLITDPSLIFVMLAHVFLILSLYIVLVTRKAKAIKEGRVDLQKTALDDKQWPSEVVQVNNNINNNFQTPVLFYVVCLSAMLSGQSGGLMYWFAVAFVSLRFGHTIVHITSNYIPLRMPLFAGSLVALLSMVITLLARLL
jgi:hypothetical protein